MSSALPAGPTDGEKGFRFSIPRTLASLREALERFPEGAVIVWLPQVALMEATQLPQRLKAAADSGA